MKILILTQVVDIDDPVLGFFHRWLDEFSKKFEFIDVICLKEGRHKLPSNVRIHSLGKETGPSRLKYITRFYKYLFMIRKHNSVFVHMNEEYVIMGGLFWKLLGKKIVLWRNFKTGSFMTPMASHLANVVCYTSPESFTSRYKNSIKMPIGIDTDFFRPADHEPLPESILFLGRLDEIKKVHVFVEALKLLNEQYFACLCGSPTYPGDPYVDKITHLAMPLIEKGSLILKGGVSNEEAKNLYQSNALYVNLTPSGSFDKTIGEAMACGSIVICSNNALEGVLPKECIVASEISSASRGMSWALNLSKDKRKEISENSRQHIISAHSLKLLTEKLVAIL